MAGESKEKDYQTLEELGLACVDVEGAGRCLVAQRLIKPGEVVFMEEPIAAVLQRELWASRCSYCFCLRSEGVTLSKCARCGLLRYCSRECQTADWKAHKVECKALRRGAGATRSSCTEDILLARLNRVWVAEEGEDDRGGTDRPLLLRELQSNREQLGSTLLSDAVRQREAINVYTSPKVGGELSSERLAQLFSIFLANSFVVWDDSMTRSAVAIYRRTSLINHACRPNCWTAFRGRRMRLTALRVIKPGEQLSLSYCDDVRPRQERLQELRSLYYFECGCLLCRPEPGSDEALLEAAICAAADCSGLLIAEADGDDSSLICDSCGVVDDAAYRAEQMTEARRLFKAGQAARGRGDRSRAKELLHQSTAIFDVLLHEKNAERRCAWEEICELALATEDWPRAYRASQTVALCDTVYFPRFHPRLALRYYMQGHSLLKQGKLSEAIDPFQRAVIMLRIACGADSPMIGVVNELLSVLRQSPMGSALVPK